ncbi:hypothetical protein SDC9_100970 [bioreactor metagenome]|uniref:Uncharacterized protein n=1 Tax=bioreactor metagenome TaxID=1076179 RepID=A0A645AMQ0_9ZZZZ
MGEGHQDIEHHAPRTAGGVDILRHAHKGGFVLIEERQQTGEVQQRTRQTVQFVDDHRVNPPCPDVVQQTLQRGPFQIAAAESAIVITFRKALPVSMFLAEDERLPGFALGIEAVELHVQPFVGAFARIDGTPDRCVDFSHVCVSP